MNAIPVPSAAVLVAVAGGFFVGTAIGLVPATLEYVAIGGNCDTLGRDNPARCRAFGARCQWVEPDSACRFRDVIVAGLRGGAMECANVTTPAACSGPCVWEASKQSCAHSPAWTPAQVGYFAGSNILGGAAATLVGPAALRHLARGRLDRTLLAAAFLGIVGVAVSSAAWVAGGPGAVVAGGSFWLFVAGHVCIGLGIGTTTMSAPQLANQLPGARNSDMSKEDGEIQGNGNRHNPPHRDDDEDDDLLVMTNTSTAGLRGDGCGNGKPTAEPVPSTLFAPAIAAGVFVTALVALLVDPLGGLPASTAPYAFLIVNAIQAVGAALVAASVVWASRRHGGGVGSAVPDLDDDDALLAEHRDSGGTVSRRGLVKRIAVGASMAVALQFTGITAVMAYAPRLAADAGLPPLLGNCLFMLWNAMTSLGAQRAVRSVGERRLFLLGAVVASTACLLTGVPTLATAHAKEGTTARLAADWSVFGGVVVVLAAFETALGPAFYSLAQAIFPPHEQRIGTGATVFAEFVATLCINVGYAPLQSALSGDAGRGAANPGSQERLGQGYLFLLFGVIGLVLTAFLAATLRVHHHHHRYHAGAMAHSSHL